MNYIDPSSAHEKADVLLRLRNAKDNTLQVWYKIETYQSGFAAAWFKDDSKIEIFEYKAWLILNDKDELMLDDGEGGRIGQVCANGTIYGQQMTHSGNQLVGWRFAYDEEGRPLHE